MLKKTLLATFLLAVGFQLRAQVTFQTKVSKNRMGINERLKVSFEMNQNGDNFTPPLISKAFVLLEVPTNRQVTAGSTVKRSFSRSYTYFLNPTRKGKLSIGSGNR